MVVSQSLFVVFYDLYRFALQVGFVPDSGIHLENLRFLQLQVQYVQP